MNRIWLTDNWHLWSVKNDKNHPLHTNKQISEITEKFQSKIDADDILIHLGDVTDPGVTNITDLKNILQNIQGIKILCKGNHDTESVDYYTESGFDIVTDTVTLYNIVFSHKPVKVDIDQLNIYSDLHTEVDPSLKGNYLNISMYHTDKIVAPILLEDLMKKASSQSMFDKMKSINKNTFDVVHTENTTYNNYDISPMVESSIESLIRNPLAQNYNVIDVEDTDDEPLGPYDLGETTKKTLDEIIFTDIDQVKYWLTDDSKYEDEVTKAELQESTSKYNSTPYYVASTESMDDDLYECGKLLSGTIEDAIKLVNRPGDVIYIHQADFGYYDVKSSPENCGYYWSTNNINLKLIGKGVVKDNSFEWIEEYPIDEMVYEDYCDHFYTRLKGLACEYNKDDKIFKRLSKILNMDESKLPKFNCKIELDGLRQLCFSMIDPDIDWKIRCEYERTIKEMIKDLEKDKKEYPGVSNIWTADGEATVYINLREDIETMNEASVKTNHSKLYFVSQSDSFNNSIINPRVPSNYMTKNNYEDGTTARVCFSTSIDGCLMALSQKCANMELYVYQPILTKKHNVIVPTIKQVPDVSITKERWITIPVKLKCIGKIKVIGDSGKPGHKYTYGDNTAELYDWDWKWITKDKLNEAAIKFINDKGEDVPKVCPKCGAKVGVFLHGEPVFLCSNKKCHKYFGVVPVNETTTNESSNSYKNKIYKFNELQRMITIRDSINENVMISGKDIVINFEKWRPEKNHNILYITGLSGSGKSTLTEKYEKDYHAHMFELDGLEHGYDSSDKHILQQVRNSIPEYDEYLKSKQGVTKDNVHLLWDASDMALSIMKKDFSTLYIVEGIQIFDGIIPENQLIHQPIIIKNTSAIVSAMRILKRTSQTDNISLAKTIKDNLLDVIKYTAKSYKKFNTFVQKAKNEFNESSSSDVDDSESSYLDQPDVITDRLYGDRSEFFKHTNQYEDDTSPYNETYQFELLDQVYFHDKIDLSESSKIEPLYPVYVMIMHSGTILANAIKNVTQSNYSHSVISFDSSMTHTYSFGRKFESNPFIGTFVDDSIQSSFYKNKTIPYALYIVPSTKQEISLMKKRLEFFVSNKSKFKYDFIGLFKNYLGISDNQEYRWFCSRFVADILNAGKPDDQYIKDPSLMRPEDFRFTNFATYLIGGNISDYNQSLVDKLTTKVLRAEELKRMRTTKEINETLINFPRIHLYSESVLNYQLGNFTTEQYSEFLSNLTTIKYRNNPIYDSSLLMKLYGSFNMSLNDKLKANDKSGLEQELFKLYYVFNNLSKCMNNKSPQDIRDLYAELYDLFVTWETKLRNTYYSDADYVFYDEYVKSDYGTTGYNPTMSINPFGKIINITF